VVKITEMFKFIDDLTILVNLLTVDCHLLQLKTVKILHLNSIHVTCFYLILFGYNIYIYTVNKPENYFKNPFLSPPFSPLKMIQKKTTKKLFAPTLTGRWEKFVLTSPCSLLLLYPAVCSYFTLQVKTV
jgi:hypothetical protein